MTRLPCSPRRWVGSFPARSDRARRLPGLDRGAARSHRSGARPQTIHVAHQPLSAASGGAQLVGITRTTSDLRTSRSGVGGGAGNRTRVKGFAGSPSQPRHPCSRSTNCPRQLRARRGRGAGQLRSAVSPASCRVPLPDKQAACFASSVVRVHDNVKRFGRPDALKEQTLCHLPAIEPHRRANPHAAGCRRRRTAAPAVTSTDTHRRGRLAAVARHEQPSDEHHRGRLHGHSALVDTK